jgi:hypothetical protein
VGDRDDRVPFRFTAGLDRLTIKVEPPRWTEADIKELDAARNGPN